MTVTGGLGGSGGPDTNNDGGNDGANGGTGLWIFSANGTLVTNSGVFVYGGAGGNGGNGGNGGASDTFGGFPGNGGAGIAGGDGDNFQITLNGTTVVGGAGGNAGDFGDTAAANDKTGRKGGSGGSGINALGDGGTIALVGSSVTGGVGGAGGLPDADGGTGGTGMLVLGNGTTISIDGTSSVLGGNGGQRAGGGASGYAGHGIEVQGSGTTIVNHGQINGGLGAANTVNGVGAAVFLASDAVSIDNYGTISSQDEVGVFLGAASSLGSFNNRSGGQINSALAMKISSGGHLSTLTNDGTIGSASSDLSLAVFGQLDLLTNNGSLLGAVFYTSDADGMSVVNNGLIDASLQMDGNGNNISVTNSGTINGSIALNGSGSHTVTLSSSSVVVGNLVGGSGSDTLNINGGTLGFINLAGGQNSINVGGTFATGNTISAGSGSFDLTVTGAGDFTAQHSISNLTDITVQSGGKMQVASLSLAGSGVLANAGSIVIDSGLTLQMASMAAGGSYTFGVGSGGAASLVLTSGAIDLTGANLQVDVRPSTLLIATGTNLLVGTGANTAQGITNGQQIADNSALLKFYLYRGDAFGLSNNDVYLQAVALLLADIASHGDDPNAVGLGGALDTIGLDGDPSIDALMLLLAQQQTDAQINAILDSLLPETDGVAYDIATDAGDQILDVASRRLDGLRGTSVAGVEYQVAALDGAGLRGGKPRQGVEMWGQAFGRIVDQRRRDYNEGYDADGYGFAVGADTAFDGGRSLIGGTFAYGRTNADGDGANCTATDVNSYQLVLYGDHLFDNRVYAKGMLGYGWHQNDIARHDVGGPLGPTVTASYDAWQFTARTEAGRPYKGGANLTLVPHLTANYAYYSPDDYRETDPSAGDAIPAIGGLGLDVKAKSLQSFRLGFGVLARWDVELDGNALLQPELRVNYRRELIGDRFETTSEFIGAPGLASFQTLGVDPARDILDLGVGALLATAGGVDIRANYDLELKQDYTAHGGYVRASVAF